MRISEKVKIHSISDAKEIQVIKETCMTIATFRVEDAYRSANKTPESVKILQEEYKKESDRLLTIASHNPDEFRTIVNDFYHSLGDRPISSLEADLDKMFANMHQIKAAGDVRLDAARNIASKIVRGTHKFSQKDLGVDVQNVTNDKKKKSLLSTIFSVSKGTFDPNTKSTSTDSAARTIDRDLFNTNKLYRIELENDVKRLRRRGGLSSEEMSMMEEHNRLKREQLGIDKKTKTESQKILASMSVGEKAMYDIAKSPFLLSRGLFNLIKRKTKQKDVEEVKETEITNKESIPKETEQSSNNTSEIEHKKEKSYETKDSKIDLLPPRDVRGRFTKRVKSDDEDAAAKEATFEKVSEYEDKQLQDNNKQIEIGNKQLELLGKISEGANGKSESGGLVDVISGFTKIIPVLEAAGAAIAVAGAAFVGFKVSETLMRATGQTDEHGNIKAGSLTDRATSWLAGSDKTMEERDKEYRESDAGKKQLTELAVRREANKHNLKDGVSKGASIEGVSLTENGSVEGVKKDISTKLKDKQEKADIAKEDKSNANMAGAVSNVVNNSPNNSVVATPQQPSGRDNPRNPDNSLNHYLNSRVIKFN